MDQLGKRGIRVRTDLEPNYDGRAQHVYFLSDDIANRICGANRRQPKTYSNGILVMRGEAII